MASERLVVVSGPGVELDRCKDKVADITAVRIASRRILQLQFDDGKVMNIELMGRHCMEELRWLLREGQK